MRWMVTGCAGFIGSHLCEALIAGGHTVVGVDCFTNYYERRLKEHNLQDLLRARSFSMFEDDLETMQFGEAIDAVDGVFHLAGQPGVRASWGDAFSLYLRRNVLVTQRVFEAAAKQDVRVVFASTSSIYGNQTSFPTQEDADLMPISPYGITKLTCEQLGRIYTASMGLELVTLRFFTVFGPRQRPDMAFSRIVEAIDSESKFYVFGDGMQIRDFTYVADAVAACIAAMEKGKHGTYNIGGGNRASMRSVFEIFEDEAQAPLTVEYSNRAMGDVQETGADTHAALRDLAWKPTVSLRRGIREQIQYARRARSQRPEDGALARRQLVGISK